MEHLDTSFKERLYQQYARIGKCLSSDKRLEILDLLSNGPKSVESISQHSEMTVANASRHLQILLEAQLVKFTKKGTYVIYELADEAVLHFLLSLWNVCEVKLPEIPRIKEDLLTRYDSIETMTKETVFEKLMNREIIVLDVRSQDEYEAGHMDGAISVPLDELEAFLVTAAKDVPFAIYCKRPYCIHTTHAVETMQKQGFTAYRIEESIHHLHK